MSGKTDFRFNRGSLALNFVATLGHRKGQSVERIPRAADLDRWVAAASLGKQTAATIAEYRTAIVLREAIYAVGLAIVEGRRPARSDIELINAAAAARRPTTALDPETLEVQRISRTPVRAALAEIAEDAIALFGGVDRKRLLCCKHPECGALILNNARGRARQWCSMETCGNRAKVAAFRERQGALFARKQRLAR